MSSIPVPLSGAAQLTNLSSVGAGRRVRVRQIDSEPGACLRLREMGFCENAEICMVSAGCPLICRVCGVRVALSRQLASSILVEVVPITAGL
jgi:ferrous iron transport protein A